jgi:hypothetical protein
MKTQGLIILLAVMMVLVPSISAVQEKINIRDYEITYSYLSEEANEGGRFTLTINIKNNGDARENLRLSLNPDSPLDVKDDEWDIDNISAGQTVSHNFRVDVDEDAASGKYGLDFRIQDNKIDEEDSFDIEISSDKPELIIGNVISTPGVISADDKNIKLDISIENTGGGDATFARAKLILPEGLTSSSSYSDSSSIGTVVAKGNKIATFYIDSDANVSSGIMKATLEITYKDNSEQKTSEITFDIPIKAKPLFEITSVKTEPDKLYPGKSGKIKVTIKNIGEEEGKETSVRIFENSDYPFSFSEKTNFVGSLKPGESGTAIFNVDIDKNGDENNYLLNIQVRTVNNNNVVVSDKTIPVRVYKNQGSGMSPILILVMAIVIILVIVLIYLVSKRKKDRRL